MEEYTFLTEVLYNFKKNPNRTYTVKIMKATEKLVSQLVNKILLATEEDKTSEVRE